MIDLVWSDFSLILTFPNYSKEQEILLPVNYNSDIRLTDEQQKVH